MQNLNEELSRLKQMMGINPSNDLINEEKADRCLRIARRKYDKPSAYRSGAIVRCRQGKIWKDLKEEDINDAPEDIKELLYKAHEAITRTNGEEYAPDVNELQAWEEGELDEAKKTDYSKEKKSGLHGWFSRRGGGGNKGWVDPKRDSRRVTSHGFRSTFRMWGAESAAHSFSREVIEFALSHQLPDKVESAYQRGTVFDKRIPLMQSWADYCYKAQETASVTPIRSAVK